MIINYTGLSGSRVAYYASKEAARFNNTLIIVSSSRVAERLREDLSFFVQEEILVLPEEEDLKLIYEARDTDSLARRIAGMKALASGGRQIVIAPVSAVLRPVITADRFRMHERLIQIGDDADPKELKAFLAFAGYEPAAAAESAGEFSSRGDILDIFSPGEEYPVRIEFFDTEIDSMRYFDPVTQRSIENTTSFEIVPAVEFMPTDSEISEALQRIDDEYDTKIIELEKQRQEHDLKDGRIDRYHTQRAQIDEMFRDKTNLQIYADYLKYFDVQTAHLWDYMDGGDVVICDPSRVLETIPEYQDKDDFFAVYRECEAVYAYTPFPERIEGADRLDEVRNPMSHPIASFNGKLQIFGSEVRDYLKRGYDIHIVSSSAERNDRIREYLDGSEIHGRIFYDVGSLGSGMALEEEKICYITENDIFPEIRRKPARRRKKSSASIDFSDLKKGDYVVHEVHGIGRFEGIKTLEADGEIKDYLKIHYAGSDVLYIPTEQMDIIQRYIGNEGNAPRLSKLSGGEWRRTRERVRKSVMAIAEDLVKLYAEREASGGYAFSKDTVWQKEFEEEFPYTETDDQLRAIEEIKADMEAPLPMDRLLCGDVGYGKTEVAARAIFKCISEGKQAVLPAPTTLLVDQHYRTLRERFKKFPFEIEMLSRFRSDAEQTAIIEKLKKGTIDLVIGTHRLLSDDVKFRDLGLLVIDEEQRFGVKHKERIKMMRKNIDVLTLSATPIPRTLNMSLTGIKNISIIEEPPRDRLPVQTYVTPEDEEMIRMVIGRELARGGQAFVIYNRVRGIRKVAETIQRLVPEAKIGIGHGQMDERSLENVMIDFVEGKTDVLVATTIVENGIDIPNANTLVIIDADKMGLSQLYQLRGRVGRSNILAYAYLTYKPEKVLTEIARKRLAAIREFTEFGAGFKLAMRDLELRGAGNVLGEAQHGHIEGVGYELYCKEIDRAVRMLKGEDVTESRAESTIELRVPARVPDEYIEDETLKLQAYKKIAQIRSQEDAEDVTEELIDRYGDLPDVTLNLIRVAEIRNASEQLGIESITEKGSRIEIAFYPKNRIDAFALIMGRQTAGDHLVIRSGANPGLSLFITEENKLSQLLELLRALLTPKPEAEKGA